jgi:segregation and condensation protein A
LNTASYQIKLPQFEGPFDLLLFFIERDELDIYNIPIKNIIDDFLAFIKQSEDDNIELSSEFILFISTLMRINASGNEIDPRQELVDKILEYKKFKEASSRLAELEQQRLFMVKRGNLKQDLHAIGEEASEGTEIQSVSLFKLMKLFEKVMQRVHDRQNKPQHVVYRYNYTMEESREYVLLVSSKEKTMSFEKVFDVCQDRLHAIFLFLTVLELVQQNYVSIIIGEGRNNFIIEYNDERPQDPVYDFTA